MIITHRACRIDNEFKVYSYLLHEEVSTDRDPWH